MNLTMVMMVIIMGPLDIPYETPKAKKSRTEAPWASKEDRYLKKLRGNRASWTRIMKEFLDRSEESVKKHWYKDLHHEDVAEQGK